jgi:hypothetical protein
VGEFLFVQPVKMCDTAAAVTPIRLLLSTLYSSPAGDDLDLSLWGRRQMREKTYFRVRRELREDRAQVIRTTVAAAFCEAACPIRYDRP